MAYQNGRGQTQQRGQGQQRQQAAPPVHKIRAGHVQADIWQQENQNGIWFSVTFSRNYKDGQGNWKSSASFGSEDLLVLSELSRLAWHWMREQKAQEKESSGQQGSSSRNGQSNGSPNGNGRGYSDPGDQGDYGGGYDDRSAA